MSSQIAANLASVQASAAQALNVVQLAASSSAANAMVIAVSQIQAAQADATAVRVRFVSLSGTSPGKHLGLTANP